MGRESWWAKADSQCPATLHPLQVDWENEELRGQLLGVTQERDLALRKSQGLQSKLESLEQVLKVRRLSRCGDMGHNILGLREKVILTLLGALGPKAQSWHHQPLSCLCSDFF